MKLKVAKTSAAHEEFYLALCHAVDAAKTGITPLEAIAILSNLIGKIIAGVPNGAISVEDIGELILKNVTEGNKQIVAAYENGDLDPVKH